MYFRLVRRRPHTRLRQRVAFAVLVGCGLGLVAPAAAAATSLTWTGAVDSNWSTAGNWSPAQVPAAGDDVTLPFTGLREPRNNDLVGVQLRSVTISFRFALGGNAVELTSGGSLTFGTGAHLAAFSVVLHGPATIDGGDGGTIGNISGTGPLTFRGDSPSLVGAGSYSGDDDRRQHHPVRERRDPCREPGHHHRQWDAPVERSDPACVAGRSGPGADFVP
jgi:hypothetical protein